MKRGTKETTVVVTEEWRLRLLGWADRGMLATWEERASAGWHTFGVYMTGQEFTVVARSLALDGLS